MPAVIRAGGVQLPWSEGSAKHMAWCSSQRRQEVDMLRPWEPYRQLGAPRFNPELVFVVSRETIAVLVGLVVSMPLNLGSCGTD